MSKKKKPGALTALTDYPALLQEVKSRIRHAQTRAVFAANAELIRLYWDIGRMIDAKQDQEGWGAGVIPRLAKDLRNELPEVKGFSERNIGLMIAFYRAYPQPPAILQQPVAKLEPSTASPVALIPWGHNILLIEKIKDLPTRLWYARQTLEQDLASDVSSPGEIS